MGNLNINDYSIKNKIDINTLYGKKIYLLGSAEYGSINMPIYCNNINQVHQYFGTQGTLIDAFNKITSIPNNCEFFLCKTTGIHAELLLDVNLINSSITVSEGIKIIAKEANENYNNIKITISDISIKFDFPDIFNLNSKEYFFNSYVSIGLLADSINQDTNNNLNLVYITYSVDYSTPIVGALSNNIYYLTGGNSGLIYTKNQLYRCLDDTYDILIGEPVDIVIPVEAFLDDILPQDIQGNNKDSLTLLYDDNRNKTYYEQLLLFCINQLSVGKLTHGIIGYNKTNDINLYNKENLYIDNILNNSLILSKSNILYTNLQFLITAVAGDCNYNSNIIDNAYLSYAVTLGNTISTITTTNIAIPNISLFTEFNSDNLIKLANLGITTLRYSPLKQMVVVTNGVTTINNTNDMHYICNVRMIQLTLSIIYEQLNVLIGENININDNSKQILKLIDSLLDDLRTKKILSDYTLDISINDNNSFNLLFGLKTIYMVEFIQADNTIYYGGD